MMEGDFPGYTKKVITEIRLRGGAGGAGTTSATGSGGSGGVGANKANGSAQK
jgi:hypothetical protein